MVKNDIIKTIESLPTDIDGYKLYIYEDTVLETWGQICMRGQLNKKKLLDIFDNDGQIKRYDFGDRNEYQFAVDYEKNLKFLFFGHTNYGSMEDCLTAVLIKISTYKNNK